MTVRENLKFSATQIKIMGDVVSNYAPINTVGPSPSEIQAAMQAGDWISFTSVCLH